MAETNLVVVDARPSRESQHFATFRRKAFWRLFSRNNCDVQGSVTAKGYLAPTFLADLLAGSIATEDGNGVFGTTSSATVGTALLTAVPFFFPANGVSMTVPIQTMAATIMIGAANNSGSGSYAYVDAVTLELVKINSSGTVTSIATQTLSPSYLYATPTAALWYVNAYQFALSIASAVTIAATDRLALRLTVTGHSNSGTTSYYAVNANGGSANATTGTVYGSTTYAPSYISLEVY
jgi:hypothetical protein